MKKLAGGTPCRSNPAVQPDLFGAYDSRISTACTVLADVHPRALELLIGYRAPDRGETRVGMSGPWTYSVRDEGFYYEERRTCRGWYVKPAHMATWTELDTAIDTDPRVTPIREWAESLTVIDAWKDRYRPYELWPEPGGWHPSHIESDHDRDGWTQRLAMWSSAIQIWRDAAARAGDQ